MLLLKNERKLLKLLRSNEPDLPRNVFSYNYLEENFYKDNPEEMYSVVRSLSLKEPKLIGICKNQNDISLGVFLENTGSHFYEYLAIKRITALLCYLAGLITPFLFSLITSQF